MKNLFMKFNNFSIRQRLYFIYGVIFSTIILLLSSSILSYRNLSNQVSGQDDWHKRILTIKELQLAIANIGQFAADASLTHEHQALDTKVAENVNQTNTLLSSLMFGFQDDPALLNDIGTIKTKISEIKNIAEKMFVAYGADKEQGDQVLQAYESTSAALIKKTNEMQLQMDNKMQHWLDSERREENIWIWTSIILVVLSVIASLVTAVSLSSSLLQQVNKFSDFLGKVYRGHFGFRMTHIDEHRNDFNVIFSQFNDVLDQLEVFFREIRQSLAYASQQKYFRKPNSQGLRGQLSLTVNDIREALQVQENAQKTLTHEKQNLARSVDHMLVEIEKFADGDLTVSLPADRTGSIGKLYLGFNHSIEKFKALINETMRSVRCTVEVIDQIRGNSENIVNGARQQSMQSMSMSATMEEMDTTIHENSHNITSVAELAKKSGDDAQNGGLVVDETIKRMSKIAEAVETSANTIEALGKRSDEIGEIIQAIEDIADQTNLLALNAAIEAARAGEQGRGFAVVADEVRKLAERTTSATKDIAEKIKNIQNDTSVAVVTMGNVTTEMKLGRESVDEAGDALKSIILNSKELADMIIQIAAASEQLSMTSKEVSKNLNTISEVSVENSGEINSIVNLINKLSEFTEQLQSVVKQFKINAESSQETVQREHPHTLAASTASWEVMV